jgi:probable O-glycosylation ligase (exosortase A-associated)
MRDAALIATLGALLAAVLAQPFIGVLLWNWIAFMNPHRLAYGLASELPWAVMVLAATLLGCLMAGELRLPPWNATTLLFVALMLCFTATSFVALGEPAAVWEKWERSVKILLGLLLTAAMLTTRQRLHALVWVMVISLGYYGVRGGIFALVTGGSYRVWGPPQTMITDNNHLAAALLISLPLMNYLRLQSAHRLVRVGLGIAMGLTLLAVVASYSRGALLGLGAVLFVLWLMSARKLLLGAGLALCLSGVVAFMPGGWSERMGGISSYQSDDSASERLVLWGISWRLALDRPLVGSGFTGPYTRAVVDRVAPGGPARAVHSIWFELLGEHGFPTFLIWAALSGVGVVQAWGLMRLARGRAELAWAGDLGRMGLVAIAAYLVSGSFLSLSYWDFYWTLLVALAGAQALALRARTAVPVPGWRGAALATR